MLSEGVRLAWELGHFCSIQRSKALELRTAGLAIRLCSSRENTLFCGEHVLLGRLPACWAL